MTSICLSQANFHQHQQHFQQQFQYINDHMLLVQPQQQQKLQEQQQSGLVHFDNKKLRNGSSSAINTKVLGTSHLQNIQPASAAVAQNAPSVVLPKKKYTYANMPYGEQLPSVARRNARERNRVKQVNNGFANLRQHLPQSVINALSGGGRGASKKLSKVDTLRVAVEYIRGLQELLEESEENRTVSMPSDSVFVIGDGSNDGYSSTGSPSIDAQISQSYKSEASVSPAPSYTDSDISIGGVNYLKPINLEGVPNFNDLKEQQQFQFRFEAFDNYEHIVGDDQPDDEELLDYISSWQEQ